MRALRLALAAALAACTVAQPAFAQGEYGADRGEGTETGAPQRTTVDPYIEASQILTWQMSPGDDVVTYTQLAAGVDASIAGRNNGASISVRYERNFAGSDNRSDFDSITGLARGYATIVPRTLTIEAGALANRTRVEADGSSTVSPFLDDDLATQTYSLYAGPNLQTRVGDAQVSANYRIGYTRVDGPEFVTLAGQAVDVFDESVTHSANFRAATRPDEPFPVGVGIGAGYFQEDIDNLDQRVRDAYVRGDITIPVTPTLAVVAGAGLEDVEVSSRDAVRDANGDPVVGPDGKFLVDKASPRRIAYDADGLIWDVGVIWRPSRRTSLEATFGHRYDSETFYGNFSWQPNRDTNVSIGVYDSISGFGGRLNNALAALPTVFEVVRDPVTGDITGCVTSFEGQGCIDSVFGSVRSAVFRGRGVSANYSRRVGRSTASVGAGYDRRKFLAAPDTVLAAANGVIDKSYYLVGSVQGPLGPRGRYTVTTYANWFDNGLVNGADVFALGSSASYTQAVTDRLSARAAIALNYLDSDLSPEDIRAATALLGLRYDF